MLGIFWDLLFFFYAGLILNKILTKIGYIYILIMNVP